MARTRSGGVFTIEYTPCSQGILTPVKTLICSNWNTQRLLLLQVVQSSQHLFAVPRRVDARIGPRNLAAGIDDEGMPRGKLYHSKICQRTIRPAHLAITV